VIKREGGREGEKERYIEVLFLFLKGMTGALAPFSYLVDKTHRNGRVEENLTTGPGFEGSHTAPTLN
jgi:hypothetical protein